MRITALRPRLISIALFASTLAAYWPALHGGFIWDDDGHVTRPDLRSLHGLWRIWTEVGATQQYYPLLHSAFWIEHRLWGDAPFAYHLLNVLLHAAAAWLFVKLLQRLHFPRRAAWFAGFLFALHPICVESVAWISEQKNTLSTVFYLLAALTYVEAAAPPLPDVARKRRGRYTLATSCFILALLTKTVTATLPAALVVVLWWKKASSSPSGPAASRQRPVIRDLVLLLPWFLIGATAGVVTAWFENSYIGAHGAHFHLSVGQRLLLAGRDVWFYLAKLIWPARFVFVYPRWRVDPMAVGGWAALAALAALITAAWSWRARGRGLLAAILLFVGALFPALGFVNVYPFVFSYVADHFAYLASLAVFALVAAAWGSLERGRAAAAGILALLGVLTWRQCRQYRDDETLFRTTVERNPSSWLAQENLGVVLAGEGRRADAISHYLEALRLNPDYAETHANYGNALAFLHRWPEAVAQYREALRLRPDFAPAAANWARAEYGWASELGNEGRLPEAIEHDESALRLRPDYPAALTDLGLAETYSGRLADAVRSLRRALELEPESAPAHAYLGLALAEMERWPEAAAEYRESLRLNPGDRDVHYHLGLALREMGELSAAADEFAAAGRPGQ